jgi:hypothetical protein
VFMTFCLSQAGMVRHWWKERKKVATWKRKILINGFGLLLTGFILISQIILKFKEGGWITLLVTGSLVLVAIVIKRFYFGTGRRLARLDHLMTAVASAETASPPEPALVGGKSRRLRFDPKAKTAVILVSGFNGTGLHTLFSVRKVFGETFRNWFFIEAGIIDADRFKGAEGLEKLKLHVDGDLARYVKFLKAEGFYAQGYSAVGTDVSDEVCGLAESIYTKHPTAVFFGGQIVFPEDSFLTRLLFNHTTFAVQRRLHQLGIPFLVMPCRVE